MRFVKTRKEKETDLMKKLDESIGFGINFSSSQALMIVRTTKNRYQPRKEKRECIT